MQPSRACRRTPWGGLKHGQRTVGAVHSFGEHLPDLAARMSDGKAFIAIDVADHRPARFNRAARLERSVAPAKEEPCSQILIQNELIHRPIETFG